MDLKGILSISGYSGLFKLITQTRNGIIVESLLDKKRMQVFATAKISALEDIALYTTGEDKPLVDLLKTIFTKADGQKTLSSKSKPEELKAFFAQVLPDYDKERVYVSDMKRVFNWYNVLLDHDMIDLEEPTKEADTEVKEEKKENE